MIVPLQAKVTHARNMIIYENTNGTYQVITNERLLTSSFSTQCGTFRLHEIDINGTGRRLVTETSMLYLSAVLLMFELTSTEYDD